MIKHMVRLDQALIDIHVAKWSQAASAATEHKFLFLLIRQCQGTSRARFILKQIKVNSIVIGYY